MSGFEAADHFVQPFKKIRLSVGTKYFEYENFYLNPKVTSVLELIFYCTEAVTTGGIEYPAGSFFIGVMQYGEKYKGHPEYKMFSLPTGHFEFDKNLSETSIDRRTNRSHGM